MAGLIPQDFIDDLLNRTDIADVVEERISLKRSGRNYSALCPFHQEKSPSFSVNPEKQFYYCFGCGAAGNAIGFVMEYDRMDFPQAVESLARRIGLEVPKDSSGKQQDDSRLKGIYQLLEHSAEFFQHQLRHHPDKHKAVDYLKNRGLSGQVAKRFMIGYAPAGWDNLIKHLEQRARDDKHVAPAAKELDTAGMAIYKAEENKCYDRFRDRIMFPITDMRGRVIAFGGRVLTDEKPKYLNSPETPVFHKNRELYGLYQARQANRALERIVIVEGYMDVVALAQFDINNAVATLGTATSEHHLTRLFKLVPEVIFCFDGDSAGRQAANRALETALPLMEDGRQARFLFLPEGEDPDSLVRAEGTDGFQQRLSQATPLSQFFFDSYSQGLDLTSGEGKARLSSLVIPALNKIPGAVFQQLMRQQLSELAGIKGDFLERMDHNTPAAPPAQSSAPSAAATDYYYSMPQDDDRGATPWPPTGSSRPFNAGRNFRPKAALKPSSLGARALKALLHHPQLAAKISFELSETLSELYDAELLLLKALIEQLRQNQPKATARILLDWQGDPNYLTLRTIAEQELLFTDPHTLEQELFDCLEQLVKQVEFQKVDEIKDKLSKSQATDDEKALFKKLLLRQSRS